ncbi:MAG: hypothetical protein GYB21_19805 [Oceanospirillales bacterium]|nr:hypothetical protein [Oceanospirillales bacterium]
MHLVSVNQCQRLRLLPERNEYASGHQDIRPEVDEQGRLCRPLSTLPRPCREAPDACFEATGKQLQDFWAAPRREDVALAFLQDYKPFARYAIYPAGALAQAFVEQLDDVARQAIRFVVDRGAVPGSEWHGLPSYTPESLQRKPELCEQIDGILVLHPTREPLLRQTLAELGVADGCVRGVYTEPEFLEWWRQNSAAWIEPEKLGCQGQVDHLIVTTNPGVSIMHTAELQQIFPVSRTRVLYLGNPNFFAGMHTPYQCLNLFSSQDALRVCIDYYKPYSIHVASVHADNYLGMLVKQAFPQQRVTHEIYDWSLFYSNHFVEPLHSANSALIDASRVGELYSLRYIPALMSKRDGKEWRVILDTISARCHYQVYFHNFTRQPLTGREAPDPTAKPQIVYAGPVAPAKRPEEWPIYEFGPMLARLGVDERINFEVFNSLHPDERGDVLFSEEIGVFGNRYHRCLPFDQLLPQLARFHYGWMCLNSLDYLRRCPDVNLVLSARLIGYITAGIPVIVDATWRAAVELVQRFHAGIVVDLDRCDESDLVDVILSQWRPQYHGQGAARLAEYMQQSNRQALSELLDFHATPSE